MTNRLFASVIAGWFVVATTFVLTAGTLSPANLPLV
ncbi:hypothetical protein ED21_31049 [Erythrobacter sp. SD-21]|nr:hypothetical protein ED21_31049 [Erythrobacter sp. SD-21]